MAYGMQVRTTAGLVDVDTVVSVQAVIYQTKTAASGTQALPAGIAAAKCLGVAKATDGNYPPTVSFSGSNVVWTATTQAPSTNFILLVLRYL